MNFKSGIDRLSAADLRQYKEGYDDAPGIFGRMDPIEGALDAYRELATLFDTYILSTAPWHNPSAWIDKLHWVQQHLGVDSTGPAYKRLILSHHKNLNRGDFLIDDRIANGAGEFEGELVKFGSGEFPDWQSVRVHLRARAQECLPISVT